MKKNNQAAASIIINVQACKATTCAMVDDLEIKLPLAATEGHSVDFDLTRLIEEGDLSSLR